MNRQISLTSNQIEFTDEEIKEQLHCFGFKHIPDDKFNLFKKGKIQFKYQKA